MDKKIIDYAGIVANLEQMILVMEFDAMRSPGKAKMNAGNLVDMYKLLDIYKSKGKVAPVKKETN